MQRLRAIALAAILGVIPPALAQQGGPPEPPSAAPTPDRVQGVVEPRVLPDPAPAAAPAAPTPAAGAAPAAAPAAEPAPLAAAGNARGESAEGAAAAGDAVNATAMPDATGTPAAPAFPAAADRAVDAADAAPAGLELRRADAVAEPVYASIWERIRAGFKMPEIDDPLVSKWEEFYVARPEYWLRIIERSKRYLHFIAEEIERRDMPL